MEIGKHPQRDRSEFDVVESTFMKRNILLIGAMVILLILLGYGSGAGEAGCITASVSEDEFVVDNSEGALSASFDADLNIYNKCNQSKDVLVTLTLPRGEDTDHTKDIYPHIFTSQQGKDRDDQGLHYRFEAKPGKTELYLTIDVNSTTFADMFEFEVRVKNRDDNELVTLPMTVEVTPYNSISIEFVEDDDIERTVSFGSQFEFPVLLKNEGNIYRERVSVELDIPWGNLSLINIVYPSQGSGYRRTINPQDTGRDETNSTIILGILLEVNEIASEGTIPVTITVETPMDMPPNDGHPWVRSMVTLRDPALNSTQNGVDETSIDEFFDEYRPDIAFSVVLSMAILVFLWKWEP